VIIAVPKARDTAAFAAGTSASARRVSEALAQEGTTVKLLTGAGATRDAVLAAVSDADEAILLCHGTAAGASVGRGLCVASQGLLPPSILPIDDVPRLGEFVLSWKEFLGLPQHRRLLVTNGCSAGLASVAAGGVRLGFEQLLGPDEPTTMIAPLWDVEREASLTWIEEFYAGRLRHPEWPLEHAFQHASLETKKTFPHPFNWAAFVMMGPLGDTHG
jgi:hypothetical protein